MACIRGLLFLFSFILCSKVLWRASLLVQAYITNSSVLWRFSHVHLKTRPTTPTAIPTQTTLLKVTPHRACVEISGCPQELSVGPFHGLPVELLHVSQRKSALNGFAWNLLHAMTSAARQLLFHSNKAWMPRAGVLSVALVLAVISAWFAMYPDFAVVIQIANYITK